MSLRVNTNILPKRINKLIGKAMHDYSMIDHGDRMLIGVSGGVDSFILAWILQFWCKKAPIDYYIEAVYIDNKFWRPEHGGEPPAQRIETVMDQLGIKFSVVDAREMKEVERTCFLCAGSRRSQLFDLAKEKRMNKLVLGHHKDDLVETFFLNMLYSGNISTMVPKQKLFGGELHIIRPLAYLEKTDIRQLAEQVEVEAVPNYCPMEKDTRRERVRGWLATIFAREPGAKNSLFSAMGNIRHEYML